MRAYRLHCFAQSGNTYKVGLYLRCAGLPWQAEFIDFFSGETRTPEWRDSVNEMGEAPVLDVLEGERVVRRLTQSGAILTWLAEATGHFAPRDEDEGIEVLRWILYDNYRFTNAYATHRFLRSLAPETPDPAVLAFLKGRADGALGVVEKHLATRPFIVGDKPTIADFSMVGYMFYPSEETGYDLAASHPNIHAWSRRMAALPGWRAPYDLLPGKPFVRRR